VDNWRMNGIKLTCGFTMDKMIENSLLISFSLVSKRFFKCLLKQTASIVFEKLILHVINHLVR
jgi:hypothetical protein